jgi:hypothetical protein
LWTWMILITLGRVWASSHWPISVALDLDREPTSILQDEYLEMEDSWAMKIYEALALESKWKDSTDEHGSFTLDIPHKPCSHHASSESAMLGALGTREDYNRLLVLFCSTFRRLVVDAYVYHKHCRFHVCTVAPTLQLKLQWHINNWWWDGNDITNDSCRKKVPRFELMTINKALPEDSLDYIRFISVFK